MYIVSYVAYSEVFVYVIKKTTKLVKLRPIDLKPTLSWMPQFWEEIFNKKEVTFKILLV